MTTDAQKVPMAALDALLEAERLVLLEGRLGDLEPLLPTKEMLIDALNAAGDLDGPVLSHLNWKLHRNQQLLDGAMEGIRSVKQRMEMLKQINTSIETYDQSGQKMSIGVPVAPTVEKRA